jgi:hypothetical protein
VNGDEKSSKPKSKKAVKKQVISEENSTLGLSGNNLAEPDQKALLEMVRNAQLEYYNKIKTNIIKEKRREIEALDTQIKEFIGPYMLIGYDLNDNPIEMVSAKTPAERDAILERLRKVMFKINQNIANSDGEDPYGFNP